MREKTELLKKKKENCRWIFISQQIAPWDAFVSELKFAMNIWVTKKATKPLMLENTSET